MAVNRDPKIQYEKRVLYLIDNTYGLVGKAMDGDYQPNSDFFGSGPGPGAVIIRRDATHNSGVYDPNATTPTESDPGTGWTAAVRLPNALDSNGMLTQMFHLNGVEVVTPTYSQQQTVFVPVGLDGSARIAYERSLGLELTLEQKFRNSYNTDQLWSIVQARYGVTICVEWLMFGEVVSQREWFLGWKGAITSGPTRGETADPSMVTATGKFLLAAIEFVGL